MEHLPVKILIFFIRAVARCLCPERHRVVYGLRGLRRDLVSVLVLFGLGSGLVNSCKIYLLRHEGAVLIKYLADRIFIAVLQAVV